MIECIRFTGYKLGRVAQWKSSGLLSHWFWVRVPARSLLNPPAGGFLVLGPRRGMLFESQHAHSSILLREDFWFWAPVGDRYAPFGGNVELQYAQLLSSKIAYYRSFHFGTRLRVTSPAKSYLKL